MRWIELRGRLWSIGLEAGKDVFQLVVDVAPLAHALVGEVVSLAEFA